MISNLEDSRINEINSNQLSKKIYGDQSSEEYKTDYYSEELVVLEDIDDLALDLNSMNIMLQESLDSAKQRGQENQRYQTPMTPPSRWVF